MTRSSAQKAPAGNWSSGNWSFLANTEGLSSERTKALEEKYGSGGVVLVDTAYDWKGEKLEGYKAVYVRIREATNEEEKREKEFFQKQGENTSDLLRSFLKT